jgi:acyl-CoA reductase-like NAD-dependent aldehyde dehydrogenase
MPRLSAAASKKFVGFIDLLDKIDRDMAAEVEHVKESIREAREYVEEWREERNARRAELLRKMEHEKRENKGLDTDFWRGV